MFNLIKADIARLLKSRSLWITLGSFALLFIAIIYMQGMANSELVNAAGSGKSSGFYISVDMVVASLSSFVSLFGFPFGILFLGIYLSSFICSEYSSGYIKNIASLSKGRTGVLLAKAAVSALLACFLLAICYVLSFLAGSILIEGFAIEPVKELLRSFSVMFLLAMATFSLLSFICTACKSKIAGSILIFLVASGMLSPFLNSLFNLLHVPFLSEYTLSHFFMVFDSVQGEALFRLMAMCIFYILVYNILSMLILRRRDF